MAEPGFNEFAGGLGLQPGVVGHDCRSGFLGTLQRTHIELGHRFVGKVSSQSLRLKFASGGEAEVGQEPIQDSIGVLDLTVPNQVNRSLYGHGL